MPQEDLRKWGTGFAAVLAGIYVFHSGDPTILSQFGPSRSDPKNRHWNKLKKALETISMEPEDLSGDFGKGHFSIPA